MAGTLDRKDWVGKRGAPTVGVRIVAALLIAGGVAGLLFAGMVVASGIHGVFVLVDPGAMALPVVLGWSGFTGLSLPLLYGDPARNLELGYAGDLVARLGTKTTGHVLGVNRVALLALAYLLWARPRAGARPATSLQLPL